MADDDTPQKHLTEIQPGYEFTLANIWLFCGTDSVAEIKTRDMYPHQKWSTFRFGQHSICVFHPLEISKADMLKQVEAFMRQYYND